MADHAHSGAKGDRVVVRGVGGMLEVTATSVVILRRGAANKLAGVLPRKEIPLDRITAVEWREPNMFINGLLRVIVRDEPKKSNLVRSTKDENSVNFKTNQRDQFAAARRLIERHIT